MRIDKYSFISNFAKPTFVMDASVASSDSTVWHIDLIFGSIKLTRLLIETFGLNIHRIGMVKAHPMHLQPFEYPNARLKP